MFGVTLANRDLKYIDLESGNFWVDGKRADLNKAKSTVGIDTSVTGYGKNQKTWWFIQK